MKAVVNTVKQVGQYLLLFLISIPMGIITAQFARPEISRGEAGILLTLFWFLVLIFFFKLASSEERE